RGRRGVRYRAEVPRGPALQDGAGEPEPRHGLHRRARPRHAAVLLSRRSVPLYLEDFAPGQVRESPPRTLTKDEIIAFARQYDPQPFHVDERAAKASVSGALVACGWPTIGIQTALDWAAVVEAPVTVAAAGS